MSHHTLCIAQDTLPMLRDTFGVTHIDARKHERQVGWLGTKRETPFQLQDKNTFSNVLNW